MRRALFALLLAWSLMTAGTAAAQDSPGSQAAPPPRTAAARPQEQVMRRAGGTSVDLRQLPATSLQALPPILDFDGLDLPDTNGEVGPLYNVHTLNAAIGIYRKSDGVLEAGFSSDALMSQGNFGNFCDTDNVGDPVVLHDTFEGRWIVIDFAYRLDDSGNVFPEEAYQCFAVSKTGDPLTGGWNFYSIETLGGVGDHPKFGIRPDGLYMTTRMFDYAASGSFQSFRAYAFDKAQMYAGAPTVQVVSFDLPAENFSVLPDVDGLPQIFADDFETGGTSRWTAEEPPNPLILDVNPTGGNIGINVTIGGQNFDPSGLRVLFGGADGASALIISSSSTSIVAKVPMPPPTFTFAIVSCDDNGDGTPGTRQVPTPISITVRNLTTGGEGSLSNGFTLNPPFSFCVGD